MQFDEWTTIFGQQLADALIRLNGARLVVQVILVDTRSAQKRFGELGGRFGEFHATLVDFEQLVKSALAFQNALQGTERSDIFGIIGEQRFKYLLRLGRFIEVFQAQTTNAIIELALKRHIVCLIEFTAEQCDDLFGIPRLARAANQSIVCLFIANVVAHDFHIPSISLIVVRQLRLE